MMRSGLPTTPEPTIDQQVADDLLAAGVADFRRRCLEAGEFMRSQGWALGMPDEVTTGRFENGAVVVETREAV